MNKIIEITEDNTELLQQEGLTLVDFWAEWCGPCRSLAPVLEKLANTYKTIQVVKVNIDEMQELTRVNDIRSIPTLILLKDGVVIKKKVGILTYDQLVEFVTVLDREDNQ